MNKKFKKLIKEGPYFICAISCLYEISITNFIVNNHSSFVNSSWHLILYGDAVYICKSYHSKIEKTKVLWHAVADKLLYEWSPRWLWKLETENLCD